MLAVYRLTHVVSGCRNADQLLRDPRRLDGQRQCATAVVPGDGVLVRTVMGPGDMVTLHDQRRSRPIKRAATARVIICLAD